jgi:hypothetical protein
MAKEKVMLATYVSKELKKALEKQAKKENRSLSNLLATVINDYATKKA